MLTLFPKFKKRMIIFEVVYVALMVTLYVLKPTASPIALALMLIVGGLFIAAAQYINAVNTHNRQLNRLYNQLDAEGFLKEYGAASSAESLKPPAVYDGSPAPHQRLCGAGPL